MYGFQAINAANGWMITFAGVTIVFTGLVILSTLIANMEKALNLWDRRGELLTTGKPVGHPDAIPLDWTPQEPEPAAPGEEVTVIELSAEQREALNYFLWISERLGETFALPHLLEKAEKHGMSRPHSHLGAFLKLGLMVEGEEDLRGFYSWRKDVRIVLGTEVEGTANR